MTELNPLLMTSIIVGGIAITVKTIFNWYKYPIEKSINVLQETKTQIAEVKEKTTVLMKTLDEELYSENAELIKQISELKRVNTELLISPIGELSKLDMVQDTIQRHISVNHGLWFLVLGLGTYILINYYQK
jgi:hypothetical protein